MSTTTMTPTTIAMPRTLEDALVVQSRGDRPLPVLKAGGLDVIDHMKEGLLEPAVLNDLLAVEDEEALRRIDDDSIGALCTLAEVGGSRRLADRCPVIAQAARSAATPQVRNAGTAAGNLLQRPRCWYYRSAQFDCLKKGGDTCFAVEGENRYHAIFGDGPCHIVHPSNLALALMVTNGTATTRTRAEGAEGRTIPIADLFHLPDEDVETEHRLRPDEIVVSLGYEAAPRSAHYEVREKQSFDWPLVMAAASLDLDGDVVRTARICAGAVAPVPWPLPAVAEALRGVSVDDESALREACGVAVKGARPMRDNAYKTTLLPVAVMRAVRLAAGRRIDDPFHV